MLSKLKDMFKNLTIKRHNASLESTEEKHGLLGLIKHAVTNQGEDVLDRKVKKLISKSKKE